MRLDRRPAELGRRLLPIALNAAAAGLAWEAARRLAGHPQPFFAPIAAVIVAGIDVGRQARRAIEVVVGVALGILVADALVQLIGDGAVALAVICFLAMAVAALLGAAPLLVTQAGTSALLVVALAGPDSGFDLSRAVDALVGGAVAVLVTQVLFPPNPVRLVQRATEPVLEDLGRVLDDIADAVEEEDVQAAERALDRARDVDRAVRSLYEAVSVGRETTRLAAQRRGARGHVDLYGDAARQVDFAVRNTRVLARTVVRLLRERWPEAPALAEPLRRLADAVRALAAELEDPDTDAEAVARREALAAAAAAQAALGEQPPLAASAVANQIQLAALDVLRGSGLEDDEARRLWRTVVPRLA